MGPVADAELVARALEMVGARRPGKGIIYAASVWCAPDARARVTFVRATEDTEMTLEAVRALGFVELADLLRLTWRLHECCSHTSSLLTRRPRRSSRTVLLRTQACCQWARLTCARWWSSRSMRSTNPSA